MLRPRIIPCLLVHNKGLYKTVKFKEPKYVGDPLNAVRIFNEKEVDELIVIDIDATVGKMPPNFELIKNLAVECRMPLCYGGGVTTVEQARQIVSLGVEKVALSAAAVQNPQIVLDMARAVGKQSVVVVLDVQKRGFLGRYEVVTHNAKKSTGKSPVELAKLMDTLGVGEIVINSVDNDGMMKGYDMNLIQQIRESITTPLTVIGGAGALKDIKSVVDKFGIMGIAAGSLFVFKGVYKAVLINYPNRSERNELIGI